MITMIHGEGLPVDLQGGRVIRLRGSPPPIKSAAVVSSFTLHAGTPLSPDVQSTIVLSSTAGNYSPLGGSSDKVILRGEFRAVRGDLASGRYRR